MRHRVKQCGCGDADREIRSLKDTKSNAAGGEAAALLLVAVGVSEGRIVPPGCRLLLELVVVVQVFVEAIDLVAIARLEQVHHLVEQVMDLQGRLVAQRGQ